MHVLVVLYLCVDGMNFKGPSTKVSHHVFHYVYTQPLYLFVPNLHL